MSKVSSESIRAVIAASMILTTTGGCVSYNLPETSQQEETIDLSSTEIPETEVPPLTPIGENLSQPNLFPTRVMTSEISTLENIQLKETASIVKIAEEYYFSDNSDPYYQWYRWNGGKKLFEPLAIPAGTVLTIPNPNLEPPKLSEITVSPERWEHNLGIHATSLSGSSEKRLFNIKLGAERLDGTIVEPYQLFSIKKAIGPTTLEGGYVIGWGYSEGEEVPMEGGGVCQIPSTLFKSAAEAGMLVVERYSHQFYSDRYGPWDATISSIVDFTFRNLYDFPVQIKSEINEEQQLLEISILSPFQSPYQKIELKTVYNQEYENGSRKSEVQQRVVYEGRERIRPYSSDYDPKP